MVGKKKRNGTPDKNGKQVKPRKEEQAKPGKEAQAKGTDNKGARQHSRRQDSRRSLMI
jgi:hypothetical protein